MKFLLKSWHFTSLSPLDKQQGRKNSKVILASFPSQEKKKKGTTEQMDKMLYNETFTLGTVLNMCHK